MRKRIFSLLVLLAISAITQVHAGLEILEVKDLDLLFIAPKGEGSIGSFKFGVDTGASKSIKQTEPEPGPQFIHDIFVDVNGKDISFESTSNYVIWRDAPNFFTEATKIATEKLDLFLTYKLTKLSAKKLDYDFPERRFSLFDVSAKCEAKSQGRQIPLRLVENCFNTSSLHVRKLIYKNDSNILEQLVKESVQVEFSIDTIESGHLVMKDERLEAWFYLPQALNTKISLESGFKYHKETKELALAIDNVHVGIISVKKLFFKLLRQQNFESMRIEGETIYISLASE